jgi:hypothetical protein
MKRIIATLGLFLLVSVSAKAQCRLQQQFNNESHSLAFTNNGATPPVWSVKVTWTTTPALVIGNKPACNKPQANIYPLMIMNVDLVTIPVFDIYIFSGSTQIGTCSSFTGTGTYPGFPITMSCIAVLNSTTMARGTEYTVQRFTRTQFHQKGARQAYAYSQAIAGKLSAIPMIDNGAGYTSTDVFIYPTCGGSGGDASAFVGGQVGPVSIDTPGSGYGCDPDIGFGSPQRTGDRGEWPVYTADSTDPNDFEILDYIELAFTMSVKSGPTTGVTGAYTTPISAVCSIATTPPDFNPSIALSALYPTNSFFLGEAVVFRLTSTSPWIQTPGFWVAGINPGPSGYACTKWPNSP